MEILFLFITLGERDYIMNGNYHKEGLLLSETNSFWLQCMHGSTKKNHLLPWSSTLPSLLLFSPFPLPLLGEPRFIEDLCRFCCYRSLFFSDLSHVKLAIHLFVCKRSGLNSNMIINKLLKT